MTSISQHPFPRFSALAAIALAGSSHLLAETVFFDTFDYTANSAFLAEGGWTDWSGTGGSGTGSGFCWGQNIVLEYEHPESLAAGDTITMSASLNRPWAGYLYGMRVILWDGADDATRVEVAGGTFEGNLLPEVAYSVTATDLSDGLTHVIFRYSHDGNWGETQEVSFAVEPAPTGWTWNSASGGSWAVPANWLPAGPADLADQAALIHLLDITGEQTITLDGSPTIGSLWFGDAAGDDGSWVLGSGTGGTLTLSAPNAGAPEVVVFNQTTTIEAVLTGSEGLLKSGAGSLELAAANTYTGDTTVAAGTLRVSHSSAIPSGAGAGNLVLTGTLDLADNSIAINGLEGSGIVTNSGTGTPRLTLGAGDADGSTFSGRIDNGTGSTSLTKTGSGLLSLTGIHGLSGDISVEDGTLVMTGGFNRYHNVASVGVGPGARVELDGGNMFVNSHAIPLQASRVLRADGGTLFMGTAMESRIGNVELSNGATWVIDRGLAAWDVLLANTADGAATVTVSNTVGNSGPSLLTGLGGLHLQGVQNFNVADVTADPGDDLTIDIPLANPGNTGGAPGGIHKLGSGTLRLRGQNTYTGDTIVTEGNLILEEYSLLVFEIGVNGQNNRITGAGSVLLDGDFDIDLSAADDRDGNRWTLVDVATVSYGPGFFIPDFVETDDVHRYDDGTAVWTFTEADGTLSVESGLDYADWASLHAGDQTAEEDFDGDGTANGVEFFMGETGGTFTPMPGLIDGTITWPRNPEANATYVVEVSTTLTEETLPGDGGWTTATEGVVDEGLSVSFRPPLDQGLLFFRLRVILP